MNWIPYVVLGIIGVFIWNKNEEKIKEIIGKLFKKKAKTENENKKINMKEKIEKAQEIINKLKQIAETEDRINYYKRRRERLRKEIKEEDNTTINKIMEEMEK